MQRAKPHLRSVSKEPETPPSYDYEHEQRKRILSRDWANVHVTAHKRKPFAFIHQR